MIVEGGRVLILAYRHDDSVAATLNVTASRRKETYFITGADPRTNQRIRLKVLSVSAFEAAVKFCSGRLI
jgi:hypothetical protein